ncbi:C40 family peptidase [Vallicoccus soli]|uniref:NlpC/P60 family protein n=1 Tax=Vallicoccus soli TaxID=2339232 RepID=A0A3A3YV93_9ACTN|nr:C40 family peptidase [Vallicoccus soli]RJK95440.1 NlpC/P60 family protein [Vallicoccus soli]
MTAVVPARPRAAALRLVVLAVLTAALCGMLGTVAPERASAAAPATAFGNRVVAVTATRAGMPYVYGAAGPTRFDCSGLTQWVYAKLGKRIPRTSRDQFAATKPVGWSTVRPGDLVFFRNSGGIYHVAVWAGGGYVWHAPRTGDVVRKVKLWTRGVYLRRV